MYKLVSVGFNDPKGRQPLNFAEKDAEDIVKAFTGDLGPVAKGDANLLRGAEATSTEIFSALVDAALASPQYFTFYFSGHGNAAGFGAADGLFPYSRLHSLLGLINAPHSMVILDVCKAESFLRKEAKVAIGAVPDVTWMDALGRATPGSRCFFSTGPDRLAGESSQAQNGYFTSALLAGMRFGRAAIESNGSRFVSDEDAFQWARRHMKLVQKIDQIPSKRGLTGNFPMSRSERHEWIGEASIVGATILPKALSVVTQISNRVFVKTRLRYEIINADGHVLHATDQVLEPTKEESTFSGLLRFDHSWLTNDSSSDLEIVLNGFARFSWRLLLLDGAGDILDEHWVPAVYPARQ